MKTEEYLQLDYNDIIARYPRPRLLGTAGNVKLGKIYQFSGLSIHTCPGKTDECSSVCYDAWSPKTYLGGEKLLVKQAWYTYLAQNRPEDLAKQMWLELELDNARIVRMHVGGDFFTIGQIEAWISIANKLPDVKFFGFTRSWRVSELVPALDRLRNMTNVKLQASVDSQTGRPDNTWQMAVMETEDVGNSITCLEQTGVQPSCASCGLCYNKNVTKNIKFLLHGAKGVSHKIRHASAT